MLRDAGAAAGDVERADECRSARRRALRLRPADGGKGRRRQRALRHRGGRPQPDGSTAGRRTTASSRRAYDREVDAATLVRRETLLEYRAAARPAHRRAARPGDAALARALHALLAVPAHDGWDGAQEEGRIDGRTLATARRRARRAAPLSPRARRAARRCRRDLPDRLLGLDEGARRRRRAARRRVRARPRDGRRAERGARLFDRRLERRPRPPRLAACRPAGASGPAQRAPAPALQAVRDALATSPRRASRRCSRARSSAKGSTARRSSGRRRGWPCARSAARSSSSSPTARRWTARRSSATTPTTSISTCARSRERIEAAGAIELHGIGVGLDLSPYYRSSHLLDLDARIGNAMFAELLRLIERGPARR